MFTGLGDSLYNLYLNSNLIDSFQIKTDQGVEEIKGANLTSQQLQSVKKHLFRGLPNLGNLNLKGNLFTKILTLNDNQLENIEFVREITRLQMLELKNNKIESIEKDGYNLLGPLRSIQHLDLSGNRFKALSKDLFAHLEHQLVKLDVCGNLFNSAPGLGLRLIDHLEERYFSNI